MWFLLIRFSGEHSGAVLIVCLKDLEDHFQPQCFWDSNFIPVNLRGSFQGWIFFPPKCFK